MGGGLRCRHPAQASINESRSPTPIKIKVRIKGINIEAYSYAEWVVGHMPMSGMIRVKMASVQAVPLIGYRSSD